MEGAMGDFANPDLCAEQTWAGDLSRAADDRLSDLDGALNEMKQAISSAKFAMYRLREANRLFKNSAEKSLDSYDDFVKAIETDMATVQIQINSIDVWDAERARAGVR